CKRLRPRPLQHQGFLMGGGEVAARVEGGQVNGMVRERWGQVDLAGRSDVAGQEGCDQHGGGRRVQPGVAREASSMYEVGLLSVAADQWVVVWCGAVEATGGSGQAASIGQAWGEIG